MKPKTPVLPPILTALPAELGTARSPARCLCSGCMPEATQQERVVLRCEIDAWNAARRQWRETHGYSAYELLVAEEVARAGDEKEES